ncbi:hypothetical protein KA005_57240, partial [bacterium]|nr:hypothetical protein [bacterium]
MDGGSKIYFLSVKISNWKGSFYEKIFKCLLFFSIKMKIYNFVPNKIKHMLYSLKTNPETGYNMTISDEDKYVWFRIAKVGTNSIERTLENNTKFSINASWMEF